MENENAGCRANMGKEEPSSKVQPPINADERQSFSGAAREGICRCELRLSRRRYCPTDVSGGAIARKGYNGSFSPSRKLVSQPGRRSKNKKGCSRRFWNTLHQPAGYCWVAKGRAILCASWSSSTIDPVLLSVIPAIYRGRNISKTAVRRGS